MDLGKSLEIALVKKGVKKSELAKQMNVVPQQVSQWIKTKAIKQTSLVSICEFLDMPVSEFIALGE